MTIIYLRGLILGLVVTELVELAVALGLGFRRPRECLLVLLANCVTNPLVVLLSYLALFHTTLPMVPVVAVLELWAVATEGLCYRWCGMASRQACLLTVTANGVSYLSGLALNYLM